MMGGHPCPGRLFSWRWSPLCGPPPASARLEDSSAHGLARGKNSFDTLFRGSINLRNNAFDAYQAKPRSTSLRFALQSARGTLQCAIKKDIYSYTSHFWFAGTAFFDKKISLRSLVSRAVSNPARLILPGPVDYTVGHADLIKVPVNLITRVPKIGQQHFCRVRFFRVPHSSVAILHSHLKTSQY